MGTPFRVHSSRSWHEIPPTSLNRENIYTYVHKYVHLVSTVVLDDDNCKSFEIVETLARPFSIFVAFQLDRLDHAGL